MPHPQYVNFDNIPFILAHLRRVEKYAGQIDSIYQKYTQEISQVALDIQGRQPGKLFAFSSYPQTNDRVKRLLSGMARDIKVTVQKGTEAEWMASAEKNDRLVDAVFKGSGISKRKLRHYYDRNLEGMAAFQKRKEGGLTLSDRVWNHTDQFKREVELGLDVGLGEGKSAADLARELRGHLKNPDQLYRRVRDARGNLVPSKAMKAYHPGTGVYRSSAKNSQRLTRTETNMAYRQSDVERYQQLDFVVGYEVHLSNNPNHCPMCEALAGKYPKNFVFRSWHPQCRCYVTSILKTPEEMDADDALILSGKPVSAGSANEVTDVPVGFKKWVDDHREQAMRPGSKKPYFIRDNYKYGNVDKGLKFQTRPQKPIPPPEPTALRDGRITRKVSSILDVHNVMSDYAGQNPQDFARGFRQLTNAEGEDYLLATDANGLIKVNNRYFGKYNPHEDLITALDYIRQGKELSFNQEYSVEGLYHEILHNKAKSYERLLPHNKGDYQRTAMEIVNQFVARHDYPEFIKTLGGKATNQAAILKNGLGYRDWVDRFRGVIQAAGADEKEIVNQLRPMLLNQKYSLLEQKLPRIIREMTGLRWSNQKIMLALEKGENNYQELLEAIKVHEIAH